MGKSSEKAMRAALKEALDLFAQEFTYGEGGLIIDRATGEPTNVGGQWVKQAREALGLDPQTGQRARRQQEGGEG